MEHGLTALRILVVEDNPVAIEMMVAILTNGGFEVAATATTGREAVAVLDQGPFDAAIVDLELPDIDGADLLAALRERTPSTRLVACSAHELDSPKVNAARRHADSIISKADLPRSGDVLRNLCRSLPSPHT